MIEIISSSALATVQDTGRLSSRRFGVGTAGAMDDMALAAANLMLGNPVKAAALEIQIFPYAVRFVEACDFAITGAVGEATLDDMPLPCWWVGHAQAGQVLRLSPPHFGCRSYLALGGGIDVPEVLGSRSTQLRGEIGGFNGRMLQKGDRLGAVTACDERVVDFGIEPGLLALPQQRDGCEAVRIIVAAEYAAFDKQMRQRFWQQQWRITPQSNRYGLRLEGKPIQPNRALELRSHGIVPGVIQIPHGGQPIIQMRDAQPTGGYPKFGTVIEADLWRLGQIPVGSPVRFIEVNYADGLRAGLENKHYLDEVARVSQLARSAHK